MELKIKKKKCQYCGSLFKPYNSLQKFCSPGCKIDDTKANRKYNWAPEKAKRRTGKKNPAYRNGHYTRSATAQRTADGERLYQRNRKKIINQMMDGGGHLHCQECGHTQSARWELHHIIYRSEKPGHEHIHDRRNLIHLCIGCHNWFHKVKARREPLIKARNLTELFGNDILTTNHKS